MRLFPTPWLPVAPADAQLLLRDVEQCCGQQFDLTTLHLRCRALPFYELFDLYELTERPTGEPPRRAYVLWGAGALQPLDHTDQRLFEVNKLLAAKDGFLLTADTLPDYLYFAFSLTKFGDVQYRLVLQEPVWLQTKNSDGTVGETKRTTKLSYIAGPEGKWRAHAAIAQDGQLFDTEIEVSRLGMVALNGKPVAYLARPVPPLPEWQPIAALPLELTEQTRDSRNVQWWLALRRQRLAPRLALLRDQWQAETSAFSWQETDEATHWQLLHAIRQQCTEPLSFDQTVSRVVTLPFYYTVRLYEITGLLPDSADFRRSYVLWDGPRSADRVHPLDWSNAPIYTVAEELYPVRLLTITASTAVAYTTFFFGFVAGRHGFFQVLPAQELRIRLEDGTEQTYTIAPSVAETGPPGLFRVRLAIAFSDSLFEAVASVQADGKLSLTDEKLLGELVVVPAPLAEHVARPQALNLTSKPVPDAHSPRRRALVQLGLEQLVLELNAATDQETLTASAFLNHLKGLHDGKPLQHKRITEYVSIGDAHLPEHGVILLKDCYFEQELRLDVSGGHTVFSAERCTFAGGIVCSSKWAGQFKLSFSQLIRQGQAASAGSAATQQMRQAAQETQQGPLLRFSGSASLDVAGAVSLDMVWLEEGISLPEWRCQAFRLHRSNLITGSLEMSGLHCEAVSVRYFQLAGDIWLPSASLDQLQLEQVYCQSVNLEWADVRKVVDLQLGSGQVTGNYLRCDSLQVSGLGSASPLEGLSFEFVRANQLRFDNLHLRKFCLLARAKVEAGITLSNLVVDDRLELSNITVGQRLALVGVQVAQDCDLSGAYVGRYLLMGTWYGFTSPVSMHIKGRLLLDRARVGHVDIVPCQIDQGLYATDAQFSSFDLRGGLATAEGKLVLQPSRVIGGIHLSGSLITGNLNCIGVQADPLEPAAANVPPQEVLIANRLRVQGECRFSAREADVRKYATDIFVSYIGVDAEKNYDKIRQQAADLPDWPTVCYSTFGGPVWLEALEVAGSLRFSKCRVAGHLHLQFSQLGLLKLHGAAIAGDLRLTRSQVRHTLALGQGTAIEGSARLDGLTVGGQLILSDLTIGHLLDLTDAVLAQGICAEQTLRVGCLLRLDSGRSQGDLDLTGLAMGSTCPLCLPATKPVYQFSAASLEVEATLLLAPGQRGEGVPADFIPGNIDLSRSRLRRLELLDELHFNPGSSHKKLHEVTECINLEEGQIGTLVVQHPSPRKLRLNGLSVQEWKFHDLPALPPVPSPHEAEWMARVRELQSRKVDERAINYILFLEHSDETQKSLYQAVGQLLYDRGEESASDELYKALRRRELSNDPRGLWRTTKQAINYCFGYFTALPPWQVACALLLWFTVSSLLFANPANIIRNDATALQRIASGSKAADPLPHPQAWGWGSGMSLALRYHLPILQASGNALWVPTDYSEAMPLTWQGRQVYWLSPHGYATVTAMLNWIITPILILLISRQTLKRARQGA